MLCPRRPSSLLGNAVGFWASRAVRRACMLSFVHTSAGGGRADEHPDKRLHEQTNACKALRSGAMEATTVCEAAQSATDNYPRCLTSRESRQVGQQSQVDAAKGVYLLPSSQQISVAVTRSKFLRATYAPSRPTALDGALFAGSRPRRWHWVRNAACTWSTRRILRAGIPRDASVALGEGACP